MEELVDTPIDVTQTAAGPSTIDDTTGHSEGIDSSVANSSYASDLKFAFLKWLLALFTFGSLKKIKRLPLNTYTRLQWLRKSNVKPSESVGTPNPRHVSVRAMLKQLNFDDGFLDKLSNIIEEYDTDPVVVGDKLSKLESELRYRHTRDAESSDVANETSVATTTVDDVLTTTEVETSDAGFAPGFDTLILSPQYLSIGPMTCRICSKAFSKSRKFKKHIVGHETKGIRCPTCGTALSNYNTLVEHSKIHVAKA